MLREPHKRKRRRSLSRPAALCRRWAVTAQRRPAKSTTLSRKARALTLAHRRAKAHGDDVQAALLLAELRAIAEQAVAQLREARP